LTSPKGNNSKERVSFSTSHTIAYKGESNKNLADITMDSQTTEDSTVTKGQRTVAGADSTWTNREAEWQNAGSRLVFTTNTADECEKWINAINWVIFHNKRNAFLKKI